MPRPREFEEADVLVRAMEVFWAKGYQATTPQDLLSAMGLGKGSFYYAFGSKHRLFLRCLRHYTDRRIKELRTTLSGSDIRTALRTVHTRVIDAATTGGKRQGCLLCNTAAEQSPHDAQAEGIVRRGLQRIEREYREALIRAQADGQIDPQQDAAVLARYFVSSYNGLQIMAKADPDRRALAGVADRIVAVLE